MKKIYVVFENEKEARKFAENVGFAFDYSKHEWYANERDVKNIKKGFVTTVMIDDDDCFSFVYPYEREDGDTKEDKKENKIDWKKIGKYVCVGLVCYLIGKGKKKKANKDVVFDVPGSENWTVDQVLAVNSFIKAHNDAMLKGGKKK